MKTSLKLLAFAAVPALCGCSHQTHQKNYAELTSSDSTDMVFAVSDSIHADSVTINEILEPMEWNFAEGCVIVNSPKNEEIFHVYAAPEFRYMYSFGKKGEGPGEFFSPNIYPSPDGKGFYITDIVGKCCRYAIDQSHAWAVSETATRDNGADMFVYAMTDDSTAVNRPGSGTRLEVVRFSQGLNVTDTIASLQVEGPEKTETYGDRTFTTRPSRNFPSVVSREGRVAFVYPQVRRIDYFDITRDGKFSHVRSIGNLSCRREIENSDIFSQKRRDIEVRTTEKNIYVLDDNAIYVYDWNGNCMAELFPDKRITSFIPDPVNSKIYGYDRREDFEKVYVFDFTE